MDETAPAQRSTFLTVLCILSFIGGIFTLWSGYRNAFTDAPQQGLIEAREKMEETRAQMGDERLPMLDKLLESAIALAEASVEHARELGYGEMAMATLSMLGIWNMWNRRRLGFWIFVVAAVGALVWPAAILGSGLMASIGLTFSGFISLVFIVLFAFNLKDMR
jgi:hypothetical protein